MTEQVCIPVHFDTAHPSGSISPILVPLTEVAFADLAKLAPYEAWEATPVEGKLQIALTALLV